jgi:hypothetical protein
VLRESAQGLSSSEGVEWFGTVQYSVDGVYGMGREKECKEIGDGEREREREKEREKKKKGRREGEAEVIESGIYILNPSIDDLVWCLSVRLPPD